MPPLDAILNKNKSRWNVSCKFFRYFTTGIREFQLPKYHLMNEDRLQALGNRISCQRRVYASFFEDSCSCVEQQHHLLQHYLVQCILVVDLFFLFLHLPQNCKYNLIRFLCGQYILRLGNFTIPIYRTCAQDSFYVLNRFWI